MADMTTSTATTVSPAVLSVKVVSEHGVLPKQLEPGSVGYVLCSAEELVVPGHGKGLIKSGIAVAVPQGTYGRVAPLSGLAWRHHLNVAAGVVDQDYRGLLAIVVFNHATSPFQIRRGDHVAQLMLERVSTPLVVQVSALPRRSLPSPASEAGASSSLPSSSPSRVPNSEAPPTPLTQGRSLAPAAATVHASSSRTPAKTRGAKRGRRHQRALQRSQRAASGNP